MKNLGRKIKELREEMDINANQLAERAGLSPAYISKLESGQFDSLKLTTSKALAEALGLTLQGFLETTGILESNESRPSLQLIRQSLRNNGFNGNQVAQILQYAELLRKAGSNR